LGAADGHLHAVLQRGQEEGDAVALVLGPEDYRRQPAHGAGGDLHLIAGLELRRHLDDFLAGARPAAKFVDEGLRDRRRLGAEVNQIEGLRGEADGAIIGAEVEPAEKVARKEGAGDQPADTADGAVLAQAGEVRFQTERGGTVGGDLSLTLRFGVDAVPIHPLQLCGFGGFGDDFSPGDPWVWVPGTAKPGKLPPSRCRSVESAEAEPKQGGSCYWSDTSPEVNPRATPVDWSQNAWRRARVVPERKERNTLTGEQDAKLMKQSCVNERCTRARARCDRGISARWVRAWETKLAA